jgi:hypothetical protein
VPKTTKEDIIACIPVAFCSAAAHSFSVFALSGICIQDCVCVRVCVCARAAFCAAALHSSVFALSRMSMEDDVCIHIYLMAFCSALAHSFSVLAPYTNDFAKSAT